MSAVLSGAAQGASTGAMFGPWGAAIGGVIGAAGGFLGGKKAKRAAAEQARAREAYANQMTQIGANVRGAWNQYGQDLTGLAGEMGGAYGFSPVAARSPFANVSMQDGTFNVEGGEDVQSMMGLGRQWLGEAGMFDRQGAQADYYGNLQALVGPQRQLQQQALLRQLQSKGMAGLGSNVGGNMLMKGLTSNWAEQDAKMAQMSMDYGGSELDRLIARGTGMFSGASNLLNQGVNQWSTAQSAMQPFQQAAWSMRGNALRSPLEGMLAEGGYLDRAAAIRSGAAVDQSATNNAATQGMIRGGVGALQNLPWANILQGMFGGGGNMPPNMFNAQSGNVDAMLRSGAGPGGPW